MSSALRTRSIVHLLVLRRCGRALPYHIRRARTSRHAAEVVETRKGLDGKGASRPGPTGRHEAGAIVRGSVPLGTGCPLGELHAMQGQVLHSIVVDHR